MPQSDLFVLEEKSWTKGGIKSHNDMGINLLSFQVRLKFFIFDIPSFYFFL